MDYSTTSTIYEFYVNKFEFLRLYSIKLYSKCSIVDVEILDTSTNIVFDMEIFYKFTLP
jgi:hypothetical protein